MVRSQRQSLVKHAKDEVQKRMSFVKEAKAQRKAEHDEIMKVLRGMLANAIASLKSQLEQGRRTIVIHSPITMPLFNTRWMARRFVNGIVRTKHRRRRTSRTYAKWFWD